MRLFYEVRMTTYHISIVVDGQDKASGPLNSVGRALGNMGNIAGGIIGANILMGIVNGIQEIGAAALKSYANYERLGMALQTLTAREIAQRSGKDMADVMGQAGDKAQELLGWIQKLAIQSPFTSDDIASSFRLAMAYGFTADEGKRLTQAMVDFASGSGATGDSMNRVALALGQIKARGKLAGQEVMQLTEAGLGVTQILAKAFGKTTGEITGMIQGGLIPADKAIQAITESLEKDFGGAAKRQAGTFSGLLSSLEDIKSVGLREFFAGTFTAIQPYLQDFVDTLSSPEFLANLKKIGGELGGGIKKGLEMFGKAKKDVETFIALTKMGFGGKRFLEQFMSPEQAQTIVDIVDNITKGFSGFGQFIDQYGPGIGETLGKIGSTLADLGSTVVKDALTWLSGAWKGVSDWFVTNGPGLETLIGKVGTAFEKVGSVAKTALDPIKSLLDTAGIAVGTAATAILQAANGDWKGAWETIKSGAQPIMDGLIKTLDGVGATLASVFGVDWEKTKADFLKSWEDNKSRFVAAAEGLKTALQPIIDAIVGFFKGIADWIKTAIDDWNRWAATVNGTNYNPNAPFVGGVAGNGSGNVPGTASTGKPKANIPGVPQNAMSNITGGLGNNGVAQAGYVDNRSWNLNLTTTQSPAVVQSSFAILKVLEYGA